MSIDSIIDKYIYEGIIFKSEEDIISKLTSDLNNVNTLDKLDIVANGLLKRKKGFSSSNLKIIKNMVRNKEQELLSKLFRYMEGGSGGRETHYMINISRKSDEKKVWKLHAEIKTKGSLSVKKEVDKMAIY